MKIVKFFEIFITLIVLFNKNNNFINCNNDEGNKNTNIYLSKCDKSYNFLENPPKFSDASDSLAYEYAQKKIFDIDLNTLHISLIKNLQFSKFRNIIDVKSSIFNCIIKTFQQMTKALPAILEEIFEYNEFCKSIEEVFSFLYEIDETYEYIIKSCLELTKSQILYNYFNSYIQDIDEVIKMYRNDPSKIFSKFDYVIICLNELYRKITGNFYPYIKDTALFNKYMSEVKYKKNNEAKDGTNHIEEFIKYFRENVHNIDVIVFFQEVYNFYLVNNFYISCFYVF
ncbi:conserved Plasmodium protein, unknown function [Plasmodium berghei]|uniref:Uncharacterized protein n=2 Tax=Plasmodium berghei TaxID=5821 RepID=A0A509AHV1_PLABA|nr:conserved Plasmodium protein, unknown function [Plasmodium berghei ANKA]CXI03470.1 conserved Plasmodium protein, unknown function [Plasmodium berghei]SCL92114.1 conserved Plasmodium protein, unknown function [Plasmodium berghei]SCM15597.1 conserved Plasmodium protein, unknown function [Plasmodium berghei]SCM17389.1 conserved Plasmodium protein, unknown function [Plasmodium berghei]SCN22650.1 conserved Plasmodium protein, unknown function [Plasmodium berghei]|eukprot:XP_034420195.1 conserved Plasmodium protein, unknown function [Plasmodium berghei ANKA]